MSAEPTVREPEAMDASEVEMEHIERFAVDREDWNVVLLKQRLRGDGVDEHPAAHRLLVELAGHQAGDRLALIAAPAGDAGAVHHVLRADQ
mgnify:CR=1 FL=1